MGLTRWRIWLLVALPALVGSRDPFQVPEDRCQTATLATWRYAGAVGAGSAFIGFIQDASGKWRRVTEGQTLINGWQLHRVLPEGADIITSEVCEPSRWHWKKERVKDGTQRKNAGSPVAADDNEHDVRRSDGKADGHADR